MLAAAEEAAALLLLEGIDLTVWDVRVVSDPDPLMVADAGRHALVVTAEDDHIAPREGTMPIFDLVASEDVTHFDRPGGHIGLIAGSAARRQIWPDLAAWLGERSQE